MKPSNERSGSKFFWTNALIILALSVLVGQGQTDQQVDSRLGIDVSHYQGNVDWASVKSAGMEFAIVKATEGTNTVDSEFGNNWSGIKAVGLVRGAYHFFHTDKSAEEQADHYIETVRLEPGDLPPILDVEITEGVAMEEIDDEIKTWLDRVENAYGVTPMVYANLNFVKTVLTAEFSRYPLWLADYTTETPTVPEIWNDWTLWQYSQSGSVTGVDGAVDLDKFQGTAAEWDSLLVPRAGQ